MWNKNERNGNADQARGKVKQAVGTLTHNDDLKAEVRSTKPWARFKPLSAGQAAELAPRSRVSAKL